MRFKHLFKALLTIAFIVTLTSCSSSSKGKEPHPNVRLPDIIIGDFVEDKTPLS